MSNELEEKRFQTKIIVTGQSIQYYTYSKPIRYDFDAIRENYEKSLEGEKSKFSLYRARFNMILTINSNVNYYSKFITLTTAKTTLNREQFLKYFDQFKKNFKRLFNDSFKYIGVLERQKERGLKENNEGSWHIHLIVFNSQKLSFKLLKQAWGYYGSLDIKKCRDISELGRYMAKYLTKDNVQINKKAILKSSNLKLPDVYRDSDLIVPNEFHYHKSYKLYQGNPGEASTSEELQKMEVDVDFYEVYTKAPKTKYENIIDLPFDVPKTTIAQDRIAV